MRTRQLGHAGPEISVIGFGAWEAGGEGWGVNPPDEQVIRAIHASIDSGIDWIDTAEIYGDGVSEHLVGRALHDRRDRMMIATKVAPRPDGTGHDPDHVRKACHHSLKRLRTDVIDLYQLHWLDRGGAALEDTWGAMAALVDEGLVRWIGVSNFGKRTIETCEAIRHVDSLQPNLSLLSPHLLELTAWCGERGIGVIPYSPLGCGLLAGTVDPDTPLPDDDWRSGQLWESEQYEELFAPGKIERSLDVVARLRPIAERAGCSLAQLSLAWLLAKPGVTSPIAGTRSADHIIEDAGAGEIDLDAATVAEIDALIPLGPNQP